MFLLTQRCRERAFVEEEKEENRRQASVFWRVLGSHVRRLSAHSPHFSGQAVHKEGRAEQVRRQKIGEKQEDC